MLLCVSVAYFLSLNSIPCMNMQKFVHTDLVDE